MRACPAWPEGLDDIWAKSAPKGEARGETLAEHTWSVLCRVADLALLRPGLSDSFDQLWRLLFWAAFLHDWGKVAPGFQTALRRRPRWRHRHEVLSLAFLDWLAPALESRDAAWLACAVSMHHKDAKELKHIYPAGLDPEDDPLVELAAGLDPVVVEKLWRWAVSLSGPWAEALALPAAPPGDWPGAEEAVSAVLRGAVSAVRRWLQRSFSLLSELEPEEAAALRIAGILLRGYLVQADHTASAHAPHLAAPQLSEDDILRAANLDGHKLYEHQRGAAAVDGSALLMAPTGSGKTEAALLWAARQATVRDGLPRLFYTLPYQASMNAMYDRLRGIFPRQVGLLHGRSALALYRRLMELEYEPGEATRKAREMQNVAALHVTPVRVFSPYHMLKAAYQLKGYEAMLADYAGAAFVFDEIHAYEPARLAMILETVRFLRRHLGCLFFVMTATLPAPVMERVQEVLPNVHVIRATEQLFRSFTRHRVRLLAGELTAEAGLAAVMRAFGDGQSVLVACNTVARAQEVYLALGQRGAVPADCMVLIHGRFNARDRVRKESQILARAGLGAGARDPVVVAATQVVEVSLNLDLDTIFSEPAPLEALVQRFGRVNRRGRLVLAPVHVFTEPADGQGVYEGGMIAATLQLLQGADGQALDEAALQAWLDAIYRGAVLQAWEDEYERAASEFRSAFLDTLRPFSSEEGLDDAFAKLFDGVEVLPACLEHEYLAMAEDRPLEAAELLVPIGWRRWMGLQRQKRVISAPGQWPPVVEVPYSAEMGLQFDGGTT